MDHVLDYGDMTNAYRSLRNGRKRKTTLYEICYLIYFVRKLDLKTYMVMMIKDIVKRALDAEDNYNLLFIGPPASTKILFLLRIIEYKKGVYFDGSNTTSCILDVLEDYLHR